MQHVYKKMVAKEQKDFPSVLQFQLLAALEQRGGWTLGKLPPSHKMSLLYCVCIKM